MLKAYTRSNRKYVYAFRMYELGDRKMQKHNV